jgi:hypothetical protein
VRFLSLPWARFILRVVWMPVVWGRMWQCIQNNGHCKFLLVKQANTWQFFVSVEWITEKWHTCKHYVVKCLKIGRENKIPVARNNVLRNENPLLFRKRRQEIVISSYSAILHLSKHHISEYLWNFLQSFTWEHCAFVKLKKAGGPPLWSCGQSSWLYIQRSEFHSWRYQIFWEVMGLERGPLSLVSTIEELLERKSSGSGLENRNYDRRGSCALTTRHFSIRKR